MSAMAGTLLRCPRDGCVRDLGSMKLLQDHLAEVHGEGTEMPTCAICGQTFPTSSATLQEHFDRSHPHGKKEEQMAEFKCTADGCQESFDSGPKRGAHRRKQHPGWASSADHISTKRRTGKREKASSVEASRSRLIKWEAPDGELDLLARIMGSVEKLTPEGRSWLMAQLVQVAPARRGEGKAT